MPNERKNILVIGATGQQGAAVVRHLLVHDDDIHVHGLTRDASSARAQKLVDQGVMMFEGDLDDRASLQRVIEGMHGVFCVTNFWLHGRDRQIEQGINAAEVAAEHGVEHFIFSGVGDHDQPTGIPHFDSCWQVDQHIQQLELPNTVLKPVFFMQNFDRLSEDILDGTLAMPLAEDVKLQLVDVDDIGKAATVAFSRPADFIGTSHNLAGDEITLEQMARLFSRSLDIEVEPVHVPVDQAREQIGEEAAQMYQWFNERGYTTDIDQLEATFGFQLTRLSGYLDKKGWHERRPGVRQ